MAWEQLANATVLKTLDTIVLRTVDEHGQNCVAKLYQPQRKAELERLGSVGRYLKAVEEQYPQLRLQTLLQAQPQAVDYGLLCGEASNPRLLIAYRWINGQRPKRKTPALCFRMGAVLGMLHNVSETFSEKPILTHINAQLLEGIRVLVESHAAFSEVPMERRQKFGQHMGQLAQWVGKFGEARHRYGLIHSDLHFGNWLRERNRLTPIDFDETAYGHYYTDLAVVLTEIETDVPEAYQKSCTEKLLEGYQLHRNLEKNAENYLEIFKSVSWALYLNWAFGPQHEEILAQKNKKYWAYHCIEKIAENFFAKKLGK
jgi:Ser/Thr protein kinase RdoA (MazF antagonist)